MVNTVEDMKDLLIKIQILKTKWCPNLGCTVRGNTGVGTTNDHYSYGGEVGTIGGTICIINNVIRLCFNDGMVHLGQRGRTHNYVVNVQGIGDGSNHFVLGGRSWNGYPTNTTSGVIKWKYISRRIQSSHSFGLPTFVNYISGNVKSLQSQLPYSTNPSYNVLTGSGQIGSQISGSLNKGFEFSGRIKPSTGGIISLGDTMIEAQAGATGGSMNKGTAFVAGGVYGTSRETCVCHQQYNGTSWSEAIDLNDHPKMSDRGQKGDSNNRIVHGGTDEASTNKTEEWNGSVV